MANQYDEDALQEALRQRYQNRELDLTPESYNRLLGMDLTKVDVPTYPADLIGGMMRAGESVTQAPMRSAMMARETGGDQLAAALAQFGEDPSAAPSMGDIDAAARARMAAKYGQRVADVALMPSDVSGILSQAELPGAGPALAAGEIKGVIMGGIGKLLEAYESLKNIKPNTKEFAEKYVTLADLSRDLYNTGKKELRAISEKIDDSILLHNKLAAEESFNKRAAKLGYTPGTRRETGGVWNETIRPVFSKRSRKEVLGELQDAFPGKYTNKQMKDPEFIKEEAMFWQQQARHNPNMEHMELSDFFQSELNKIKPPEIAPRLELARKPKSRDEVMEYVKTLGDAIISPSSMEPGYSAVARYPDFDSAKKASVAMKKAGIKHMTPWKSDSGKTYIWFTHI